MQENGKSCSDFNPEAFLHIQGCYPLTPKPNTQTMRIPPRLFSDKCVNVFFQEWAPLFPVLHKPTFLRVYEEFVADPEKVKNHHKLAQLYLVFSIASLSSEQPDLQQIASCETQWQRSLEAILMDNTMLTLQCLVLALMYCATRADYKRLQYYKGIAVGLSHRLGLHQSQKRFSFGALTIETRKKVFWTLYTLDCFSAAILGLPKILKDDDIHAEYPSDTDDEYVTEKGFQPSLPGEHTRISSALALFRASRILGKVLDKIYPAAASHELSLQQMAALESELNDWSDNLPQHLKLTFKQDKPSTDVTGSRSPLLSLAYYYTRTLIYRPAISSSLGAKAASAMISVGESSKRMIQIVQLLEERNMSFSFCLNKSDTLILCGMALLYQTLDLKHDSKVYKDNEKLANDVVNIVTKLKTPGSYDFKRVTGLLVTIDEPVQSLPTPPRQSPEACMAAPPRASPPAPIQTQNIQPTLARHGSNGMSETDLLIQQEKLRRMAMSGTPQQQRAELYRARSRSSFDSLRQEPMVSRREHRLSLNQAQAAQAAMIARVSSKQNLDYLPLNSPPSQPTSPIQARGQQSNAATQLQQAQLYAQIQKGSTSISAADWDALLGSIEGGPLNIYDTMYGGPGLTLATTETPASVSSGTAWSPESWDLRSFNLGDFGPGTTQSVLSISEDSLSPGDASSDLGMSANSLDYTRASAAAGLVSITANSDGYLLDGLENFGL